MRPVQFVLGAVLGSVLAAAPSARPVDPDYAREIDGWRAKREEGLRAPDGWLAVVGLTWLREGTNTIGSAPGSDVVLPAPAPARVGTIEFVKGRAVAHVAPGVVVKSNDQPVVDLEMHSDKGGKPDVLTLGPLSLYVIERGWPPRRARQERGEPPAPRVPGARLVSRA
jgi:hypothetical protein